MRDLLQQTLAALATVHARNATHRDIKPENLLLSAQSSGRRHTHHTMMTANSAADDLPIHSTLDGRRQSTTSL